MLTILLLGCEFNSNCHLVFGFRFGIAGHFLYIVSWEEKLHLSAMVTFPPVASRWMCLFCMRLFAIGHAWRQNLKCCCRCICVCVDSPVIVLLWYIVYPRSFTEAELIWLRSLVAINSPHCTLRLKERKNTQICIYLSKQTVQSKNRQKLMEQSDIYTPVRVQSHWVLRRSSPRTKRHSLSPATQNLLLVASWCR